VAGALVVDEQEDEELVAFFFPTPSLSFFLARSDVLSGLSWFLSRRSIPWRVGCRPV
jgi:hypothetical protein